MLEAAPLDVVGCCALEPPALFLNNLMEPMDLSFPEISGKATVLPVAHRHQQAEQYRNHDHEPRQ